MAQWHIVKGLIHTNVNSSIHSLLAVVSIGKVNQQAKFALHLILCANSLQIIYMQYLNVLYIFGKIQYDQHPISVELK